MTLEPDLMATCEWFMDNTSNAWNNDLHDASKVEYRQMYRY
jgi:hypothetical protein